MTPCVPTGRTAERNLVEQKPSVLKGHFHKIALEEQQVDTMATK